MLAGSGLMGDWEGEDLQITVMGRRRMAGNGETGAKLEI